MAHLSDYNGATLMISGLTPKGGTFPLAEAHDILVGENDKRLDEALTELSENDKRLDEILREISTNGGVVGLTEITYEGLKALRDEGNLAAGTFYRITDYVTTTAQLNTKSAYHKFDVIVLALTEKELSEQAYATYHIENGEIDSYFGNSAKLNVWELRYCLDNDTERFEWALDHQIITNLESMFSNGRPLTRQPSFDNSLLGDYAEYKYAWGTQEDVEDSDTTNFIYSKNEYLENGETVYNANAPELQVAEVQSGKGVIYYLKDEHENECAYDFKNILFLRDSEWVKEYHENGVYDWITADDVGNYPDLWLYTFSTLQNKDSQNIIDNSVISTEEYYPKNNIIKSYSIYSDGFKLGNNVFVSTDIYNAQSNTLDSNCRDNTFSAIEACIFGKSCYENVFAEACINNTFADSCRGNILYFDSADNVFDRSNSNNIVSGRYNHLLFACHDNKIEGNSNTLEILCANNVLEDCYLVECGMLCEGLELLNINVAKVGINCNNIAITRADNLTIEESVKNVVVASDNTERYFNNVTVSKGISDINIKVNALDENGEADLSQKIYRSANVKEIILDE